MVADPATPPPVTGAPLAAPPPLGRMPALPPVPIGGAFGPPGGMPAAIASGLFSGPPGGISGPPGGVAPMALAPLTLHAPLPGAMQAGALAPPPRSSVLEALAPGSPASTPGAVLPGAAAPLALPDLAATARAALESVIARGEGTPAAPAGALPPPPPPGSGTPPPGLWRAPAPPPRPAPARLDRARWPGAVVVPEERDLAQRIGDDLYPLVERLRDSRLSWFAVVALFGITVPIILLRQSFDVRLRLVGAVLVFLTWLGVIQDIF